jgi:hypothetical protein
MLHITKIFIQKTCVLDHLDSFKELKMIEQVIKEVLTWK